eukprot:GHVR01160473.1.p1 GENE.GHVR01160473.1~~GHVR01160473.1.p1  ORF type:complete len:480 (+),score=36.99 GHVR01160473.1:440-1879(+)
MDEHARDDDNNRQPHKKDINAIPVHQVMQDLLKTCYEDDDGNIRTKDGAIMMPKSEVNKLLPTYESFERATAPKVTYEFDSELIFTLGAGNTIPIQNAVRYFSFANFSENYSHQKNRFDNVYIYLASRAMTLVNLINTKVENDILRTYLVSTLVTTYSCLTELNPDNVIIFLGGETYKCTPCGLYSKNSDVLPAIKLLPSNYSVYNQIGIYTPMFAGMHTAGLTDAKTLLHSTKSTDLEKTKKFTQAGYDEWIAEAGGAEDDEIEIDNTPAAPVKDSVRSCEPIPEKRFLCDDIATGPLRIKEWAEGKNIPKENVIGYYISLLVFIMFVSLKQPRVSSLTDFIEKRLSSQFPSMKGVVDDAIISKLYTILGSETSIHRLFVATIKGCKRSLGIINSAMASFSVLSEWSGSTGLKACYHVLYEQGITAEHSTLLKPEMDSFWAMLTAAAAKKVPVEYLKVYAKDSTKSSINATTFKTLWR